MGISGNIAFGQGKDFSTEIIEFYQENRSVVEI